MNKKEINDIPVQGAEVVKEKRRQKKSVSYALKAIKKHTETLEEGGVLDGEQVKTINEYVEGAAKQYIKEQYGIA